ncbi:MAG: hypothetical protein KDB84_02700 [Flavobacteriales bacterium]|nr:hypothetical protein [Flavobacteriales bacterium]
MVRTPPSRSRSVLRGFYALLVAGMLAPFSGRAEHFSGSSITYECLGGDIYNVFLDLYLDCSGAAITSQSIHFSNDCGLNFTVGSVDFPLPLVLTEEVSPLCASEAGSSTCNGGTLPGYRHYRYQTTVYLSPCDKWTMEWYICCRHAMVNLLNTPGIYASATLNNTVTVCDNSPRFVDSGVPHICVNDPVSYNPGVTDPDGNTMVFSLINARFGSPAPVDVAYASGFSGATPFPGISINPSTGQVNFTPTVSGTYVVVIQVATYTPGGVLIGTAMRDLMFVVLPCDENAPVSAGLSNVPAGLLVGPNSIAACQGVSFCVDIVFTDLNPAQSIAVTSNAVALLPGATFNVVGTNPAVGTLCWTGNSSLLPVNVFVQANDGACPIPNVTSRSIFLSDCIVLPVELLSFTARPEGDMVLVEWSTASETRNDHFTVERSRDGTEYQVIGTVDGAGNSQEVIDYRHYDRDPLNGVGYYRLGQTDLDGTVNYSNVVPVTFSMPPVISATPDQQGGWLVSGVRSRADWSVVDMTGRTLASGVFDGQGTGRIPPLNAARGVLVLTVRSVQGDERIKLPAMGTLWGSSTR